MGLNLGTPWHAAPRGDAVLPEGLEERLLPCQQRCVRPRDRPELRDSSVSGLRFGLGFT